MGTQSPFAAINSDLPARDFCLVICRDVKQNLSTKYHVCCWTKVAMETLKKKKITLNRK